jgi:class 3 adenylate cyclase
MDKVIDTKIIKVWFLRGLSTKQVVSRVIFCLMILSALLLSAIITRVATTWIDKPFAGFLLTRRMVVGYFKQYYWTGTQAGLRYPDKILKANNKNISSMKDLEEVVANTNIGDPIRYSVEREGKIIDVAIPSMRFSGTDFLMIFGIPLFEGIVYLILGVIVFILKPDTKVSWLFLLACFNEGIICLTTFDGESTHFLPVWIQLFMEPFLPAIILHLSLLFPEKSKLIERYPHINIIPYIPSTALVILFLLLYPRPSSVPVYRSSLIYTNISVLALIAAILHAYLKKSSILATERAKVILFGTALAFPIPAAGRVVAFMGGTLAGMKLHAGLLSIPMMIFPAAIAYAIAKHNLFDVDVYIKRAVGYGVMTGLVGLAYFSMQVVIRSVILQMLFGESAEKIYPFLFGLIVVFLFIPILRRVQKFVDRAFYRLEYDYQETARRISETMRSLLNLDQIKKKIIDLASGVMFIDSVSIMLLNPEQKVYEGLSVSSASPLSTFKLPDNNPLFHKMVDEKKEVTVYDVEEDPSYDDKDREAYKKVFDQLGATLIVPLIYEDRLTGLISLGNKKTGKFYRREDINLLKTMANQGAVAIENARLADQMKNEELVRANLARYLSPQIVDQVIKKKVEVNLGGDRKVVTVLFSDIRNFTRISESLPPDKLVYLLNEYFTEMAKIIFENQGSLDKYIGDAIVAVFGSLIPLENSSQTAIQASIQMMKELSSLNARWKNKYGFPMDIGIGINTGEVFLGNIGSPERMEFTVIGDTVNIASRFSDLAKAGQILVTKETLSNLGPEIKYTELLPTEVKGKTGKLEVFEILY